MLCQAFDMTDKKFDQSPYAKPLARLGSKLAQLDEPTANELLEDMTDHVRASVSEHKSASKPDQSLKQVAADLGLDGKL